jgi:hypothetical protein
MSLHEEEYKGYNIEVIYDDNPFDPREDGCFGKMVCFHRRYGLGDKHNLDSGDFGGWNEVAEHLVKKLNAKVILPLYLYDHSGLHLKVGSWYGLLPQGHAEFDSGQVGFIYCTAKDIRENWGRKRATKQYIKKAENLLKDEVRVYAAYLNGEAYGYVITDKDGERVDSLYGFLGDYNGTIGEAKAVIDHIISEEGNGE